MAGQYEYQYLMMGDYRGKNPESALILGLFIKFFSIKIECACETISLRNNPERLIITY